MDIKKYGKIGFGTFGSDNYNNQTVANAVYMAIQEGYRIFDCASVYGNEKEIGKVFEQAFLDGLVKREELYIISKVWNDKHNEDEVIESCKQSLKDLGLQYIDLYIMHWPFPNYHAKGCDVQSRNVNSRPFFLDDFMISWHQMETLKRAGLAKEIAMSNMTIPKFEEVLPHCEILPYAHEMELHPSFQQDELFEYCKKKGMEILGYCPLGSPNRPERDKTEYDVNDLKMDEVLKLAEKYNCHSAEICLKWAEKNGHIPIPFASSQKNIVNNLNAMKNNLLSDEDYILLKKIDKNCRLVKGHVFLWNGAKDWTDLWDVNGKLENWQFKNNLWIKE